MSVLLMQDVTVPQFKALVQEKTEVPSNQQVLIFGGKQFEDSNTLADYGVQARNTVYLVMRLPGGSNSERPFPGGVPCLNKCCSTCFCTPSLKMPCGHFYCPTCIVRHSWSEANSGTKTDIRCWEDTCKKEWKLSIIQQYGSVTDPEMDALKNKLSENFIRKSLDIRDCPGCGRYCKRMDNNINKIYCQQCAKEKRTTEYCFHCSKPWKNQKSTTDCGNSNCDGSSEATLNIVRSAPYKQVIGVSCPSIRLCPKCGCRIEHERDCKHMKCPNTDCLTEFCFICLRTKQSGAWQCGSYKDKCAVAQIQTVIPKL